MRRDFDPSFVTQYQPAFTELVRLGSIAAQKKVQGKDTLKDDDIAQRLLTILQALDSVGLTVKEVDALEYCLLRLNESLVRPTIEALVNVTPTVIPLVNSCIIAAVGSYTMTMQEVVMTKTNVLRAEPGAFLLSGQDVGLDATSVRAFELAMGLGSFIYTGVPATLVYNAIDPYLLSILLNTIGGALPSWRATFTDGVNSTILNVTGDGNTTNDSQKSLIDMTCTVIKTHNAGITLDAGNVVFLVNGIDVNTQTFLMGANLDGTGANYIQHTFTGLSEGDTLLVIVTEG